MRNIHWKTLQKQEKLGTAHLNHIGHLSACSNVNINHSNFSLHFFDVIDTDTFTSASTSCLEPRMHKYQGCNCEPKHMFQEKRKANICSARDFIYMCNCKHTSSNVIFTRQCVKLLLLFSQHSLFQRSSNCS